MGDNRRFFTWSRFFALVILFVGLFVIWMIFYDFDECNSWDCFSNGLEDCDRVLYVGGNKMIFEYKVIGEREGMCEVNVELLQGELNNKESLKLEGQEMKCRLPLGLVAIPGSDINRCTGELKEGLQGLVIQRLHAYIVQNLGKINLDVLDVPN